MQAEYKDDLGKLFGPVEEYDSGKLLRHLASGAEKVNVFKTGSTQHEKAKKKYSEMNNPYRRILNRAEYWQSKLEACVDEIPIEASTDSPNTELIKECVKKTDRYLRHIKRLSRLALQIENQELKEKYKAELKTDAKKTNQAFSQAFDES